MNFIPLLIMNLILLVITVLLVVADRLLVTYGECKITVKQEDGEKEILVQGGDYLHAYLAENKINISSSCGGKASCGYCKVKVLNGGGQILPTEEIFMTREEIRTGMRLACQVKIKNDIEIYIPDFLTTVKDIVKNKLYDTRLKWNFKIANQIYNVPEEKKVKLDSKDEIQIQKIIEKYTDSRGAVVPILQDINDKYSCLPETVLRYASNNMNINLSTMFRIATFYNAFSLKQRGEYIITVCLGTACHVKGAGNIISTFEKELNIKVGETTEDMFFTLDAVRCIGCCGLAPVLKINEDIYGLMTKKKVSELLKKYRGA